ncbi:MAG: alpha,alpha-phosphotrehalase, partial [Pseudobutyrivibrio sp.]|nr:alpha,alpha-phosphotrehalase [Pseudobutyrivibrio sp.]
DGRRFYTDGPRVHEFLKELVADTGIADMITVGEMSSTTIDNCIKYSNPSEKELSMVFSFHHLKVDYKNGNKWELMPYDKSALKKLFKDWQEQMSKNGGWNAVFWTNHDQPRTISRFGNEEKYWKESGKLFAGIIHFMRGTPYIYQGEEIGMLNTHFTDISQYRDVESLNYFKILQEEGKTSDEALSIINERSRDNCRTPMQWDSSVNDGFTTGTPWIEVPEYGKRITAESQINDDFSIFAFYKRLISLRKQYKIISDGEIAFDESPDEIISYERRLGDKRLRVVGNLSEKDVAYSWSSDGYDVLIGNYDSTVDTSNGQIKLRPYEFAVFKNF